MWGNLIMGKFNDKDYRNIGIAMAIGNIMGANIQKVEFSNTRIYTLNTPYGEFAIDPENNYNNLKSMDLLNNILQGYKKESENYYYQVNTTNKQTLDKTLANIFNTIKYNTLMDMHKLNNYKNNSERTNSPEAKRLLSLDGKIMNFVDAFYDNTEPDSTEYKVLENALSTYDLIFGKQGIDEKILRKEIQAKDIEPYYNEVEEKINTYASNYNELKNMLDTDLETLLKEFLGDMGDEDSNYPDDDYDIESTKPMFGKIKANSSDVQSNLETSDVKDKFTQYFDKKMEYLTNTEDSQNTSNVIDNIKPNKYNIDTSNDEIANYDDGREIGE